MSQKGYDLIEYIESLYFNTGDYRKIRWDFYSVVTKQLVDSFGKQCFEWCSKNNLIFTGHYLGENGLKEQATYIGSVMPYYESLPEA